MAMCCFDPSAAVLVTLVILVSPLSVDTRNFGEPCRGFITYSGKAALDDDGGRDHGGDDIGAEGDGADCMLRLPLLTATLPATDSDADVAFAGARLLCYCCAELFSCLVTCLSVPGYHFAKTDVYSTVQIAFAHHHNGHVHLAVVAAASTIVFILTTVHAIIRSSLRPTSDRHRRKDGPRTWA